MLLDLLRLQASIAPNICVQPLTEDPIRCDVKTEVIDDCEWGTLPDGSCMKFRVLIRGGESTCIKEEDFVRPKLGPVKEDFGPLVADYTVPLYIPGKILKPGTKKHKQCCGKNVPQHNKNRYYYEALSCQEVKFNCENCFRGCS